MPSRKTRWMQLDRYLAQNPLADRLLGILAYTIVACVLALIVLAIQGKV